MKKLLPFLAILAACSTGGGGQGQLAVSPSDARLSDLQKSMTEMLERIDVLNDRIARLEAANDAAAVEPAAASMPARPSAPQQTSTPMSNPPATERTVGAIPQRAVAGAQIAEMYRNALVLYGRNRGAEARAAFQQVFNADPSGELADNALFWIGETYFAVNDLPNAMTYYRRVTEEFGDQNKAPDAMYKLGVALGRTSDLALARTTLQQVITRYPYSSAASQAKAELNRIKY